MFIPDFVIRPPPPDTCLRDGDFGSPEEISEVLFIAAKCVDSLHPFEISAPVTQLNEFDSN